MSNFSKVAFNAVTQHDVPIEDVLPTRMHTMAQRFMLASVNTSSYPLTMKVVSARTTVADDLEADYDRCNTPTVKKFNNILIDQLNKIKSEAKELLRVPKAGTNKNMRFGVEKWIDGQTMVPIGRVQEFLAAGAVIDTKFKDAKADLRPMWDEIMLENEQALGKAFDADQMPSYDEFCEKWELKFELAPLPPLAAPVRMDDAEHNDLVTQVYSNTCDKVTEKLTSGWKHAANQLVQSLSYVTAVLANDSEKVRAMNGSTEKRLSKRAISIQPTLIPNFAAQVKVVRDLAEACDDDELLQLANDAATTLGALTTDTLRKNPMARKEMAKVGESLTERAKQVAAHTEAEAESAVDELIAFL